MTNPVNVYTVGTGTASINPVVALEVPPTINTINYPVGQIAIVKDSDQAYILTSKTTFNGIVQAHWMRIGNNIIPPENSFPITPFVVGKVGQAGYQTVQSAIDAAFAAGGGSVYIQSGGYFIEDLTIPVGVDLIAVSLGLGLGNVIIDGNHTIVAGPDGTQTINIQGIQFITNSPSSNLFSCTTSILFNIQFLFCSFSAPSTATIFNASASIGNVIFYSSQSSTMSIFHSADKFMSLIVFFCPEIGGVESYGFQTLIIKESNFYDGIIADGGNSSIYASTSNFTNRIFVSGNSYYTFLECDFSINTGPMIVSSNTTAPAPSILERCRFNTTTGYDVSGTGSIAIYNTVFSSQTSINPTLTLTTPAYTVLGKSSFNSPETDFRSVVFVGVDDTSPAGVVVSGDTTGPTTTPFEVHTFLDETSLIPVNNIDLAACYRANMGVQLSDTVTINNTACFYGETNVISNARNITNSYVVYAGPGVPPGDGPAGITNAYGGYFSHPIFTRTASSIAVYADDVSIGYPLVTPPVNGAIIAGPVGIGLNIVPLCAAFAVQSTEAGILFPVVTTVQKNAIPAPVQGLVVYDSTLNRLSAYNGTAWT